MPRFFGGGEREPVAAQPSRNTAIDDANAAAILGSQLHEQKNDTEALPLLQFALTTFEKELGPDHLHVAQCVFNVAAITWALGRPADAEPLYKRALAIREKKLGPDHLEVAEALYCLGCIYITEGGPADMESAWKRSRTFAKKRLVASIQHSCRYCTSFQRST